MTVEGRSGSWEATRDTQVRGESAMGRVGAEKMEEGGQTHDRFQQDEEIVKGMEDPSLARER